MKKLSVASRGRGVLGLLPGLLLTSWALLGVARAVEPDAVQAAHDLVKAQQYPDAIQAFERLYAQTPDPKFLLNIAVIYKDYMPGRCPDTLRALERFFVTCTDCPLRAPAEEIRAQTRRTCMGKVTITTVPVGATARFDDGPPQVTPTDVELVEGAHVISLSLAAHQPVERMVMVKGGATAQVDVVLAKVETTGDRLFAEGRSAADAGAHARALALFSQGDALDQSARFALAIARARLALGDCADAADALDQFKARCADCGLAASGRLTRDAWRSACGPAAPPAEPPRTWRWIALGAGALGVTAGGVFAARYVDATDRRDAAQRDGAGIDRLNTLHDAAVSDYQWMQAGFILGGLGLGTAATLWLLDDDPSDAPAVSVGPGQIRVFGRF